MAADASLAIGGCSDHSVQVWELGGTITRRAAAAGQQPGLVAPRVRLAGHKGPVWACALSEDRRRGLTGGEDCQLLLWDLEGSGGAGSILHVFVGHVAPVHCCALQADGSVALSGSKDGTARIWATGSASVLRVLDVRDGGPVWGCALSADGARVITASEDGQIRVWHCATLPVKQLAG
jgi:WD40 repeat protein